MSFQAYLDTVKAKTGKTSADFALLAAEKGLTQHGELVAWLKGDFELGHGHANAVVAVILKSGARAMGPDAKLEKVFAGKNSVWLETYHALLSVVQKFGEHVNIAPTETYVSLRRGSKKFATLQPTAERLDIGLKLKGLEPTERLERAGSWNAMVTHRVRVTDANSVDSELLEWLKRAYQAA